MKFLNSYEKNVVIYDLINKFNYKTIKDLPTIKKIILNFGFKTFDLKILYTSLLALELITGQKGIFTKAKKSNILLKIRKGSPVGSKVVLKKQFTYQFLNKLVTEILPRSKPFKVIIFKPNNNNTKAVSFNITNILVFSEFEKNYYLFHNLPELDIVLKTNTKSSQELLFLLNSFKLPFLYKSVKI